MAPPKHATKDAVNDALEAIGAGSEPAVANKVEPKAPTPVAAVKEPTLAEKQAVFVKPGEVTQMKRTTSAMRFRLRSAGELHNVWDETAQRGTTLEDVKDKDYWKHVARNIKPHDEIIVISEDGAWRAHLFVNNADVVWAVVTVLDYKDLANQERPQTQEEEYDITWTSFGKFAITKKGNEHLGPLKDGFQTKVEAYTWLDGHLKTINA